MSEASEPPGSRPERGILDTNAVVLADRLNPDDLPHVPVITAITLAELSVGPLVTDDPSVRARRQRHLQAAESAADPLPFDAVAARSFATVAAALHQAGRKTAARTYDAMIAAIAIAHDLPLYTCNPRDFESIDGLDVRPIRHPDVPADEIELPG
ncbi:MAG: type II toxin-antitoxin system VapC family toxin [Sporichthyaceae bacterium]